MSDLAEADNKLVAIETELEKNHNDWEAWAAKADVLCAMGMYKMAIRCCDKSLALNPDNILTLITKKFALDKLEKHNKLRAAIAEAVISEFSPNQKSEIERAPFWQTWSPRSSSPRQSLMLF